MTRQYLSLIHISEPTRQEAISYAVFCLILTSHQLSHLYGCCTTYRQVQILPRVLYICSGQRYGAYVPRAVYYVGFVSGGCVDDTAVAFQRYEDSKSTTVIDMGFFSWFWRSAKQSANHNSDSELSSSGRRFDIWQRMPLPTEHSASPFTQRSRVP